MKFNLKNRPKVHRPDLEGYNFIQQYNDWFVGFEKELRELAKNERNEHRHGYGIIHVFIKEEILGEDSS